ncbi:sensor histidine kinase [Haloarcula salina]|uniref:histidine kinase n=1 Tax=Haloarcula salina TaxID=1429914 RepID=A0AA41KFR5_9EURY|nr:PAS domain-containing sensor histidine kinase [Haloarcula salina]MBV0902307.1 PAS domain-containing sensor histidine kinase [Haloarcula salina]
MSDDDRFRGLFEHTSDAVAEVEFVDDEPVVRAVNDAFVDIFGVERDQVRGDSLTAHVEPDGEERERPVDDDRTAGNGFCRGVITRETATGPRQFSCRVVSTESDRALVLYTDVTAAHRMEQHHQVLHRVLRHNLRNKLVPLLDGAERLSTELSGDLGQQASLMAMAARELSGLSETAGKLEYVMESTAVTESRVDLVACLRSVLAEYDASTVDVAVEGDGAVLVAADDRLEVALAQLVENGIKHADGEPGLSISIRSEAGDAVAEISDDGPGLPENERAVLFGDQPITQLRHSTGLGLWLTKWILECHGGSLAYDRRDERTTLTVRVPLATERPVVANGKREREERSD